MEKDPSPLDTLRQLKEWLDAGTITPQEFETLKRKLLFSESVPPPVAPAAPPTSPAASVPPVTPVAPTPPSAPPVASSSTDIANASVVPLLPRDEPSTSIGPVEDPLMPPVVHSTPAPNFLPPTPASPTPDQAPPVASRTVPLEPVRPVESRSRVVPPAPATDAYAATPERTVADDEVEEAPYTAPAKSPLSTILIIGGIVALLALVAYLMLGNRESEHLSSTSQDPSDTVSVAPEVGPQSEQIELAPAAAPETVRVAPAIPPAAVPAAPAADTSATSPAAEQPQPAAPDTPAPADNSAAEAKIRAALTSYYEDLKAPPFNAEQHFAPTVERFYTLQNTTPAAIGEELARSHFPEFTDAETQGVPGSLRISEPVNDGSRVVTYLEKSRAFRQSRQQHQQTTAQVRVRFDKNYKIVYLRQEKLLENTFSE